MTRYYSFSKCFSSRSPCVVTSSFHRQRPRRACPVVYPQAKQCARTKKLCVFGTQRYRFLVAWAEKIFSHCVWWMWPGSPAFAARALPITENAPIVVIPPGKRVEEAGSNDAVPNHRLVVFHYVPLISGPDTRRPVSTCDSYTAESSISVRAGNKQIAASNKVEKHNCPVISTKIATQ